jgi:hypothetical protein
MARFRETLLKQKSVFLANNQYGSFKFININNHIKMINHWLEDFCTKVKPIHFFWVTVFIDIFLLIVVLFLSQQSSARFTVDALTQQIKFISKPGMPPPLWGDVPVFIQTDVSYKSEHFKNCKLPKLRLPETLSKTIEVVVFIHKKGELKVTIKTNDASPVGELFCENKHLGTSHNFEVLTWAVREDSDVTLPFNGIMTLGAEAPNGTTKIRLLISGILITEAVSFPFKTSRAHTETTLRLGDKVELFQDNDQNLMAISHGIIRSENSALRVVAHATADEARVLRLGQDKSRLLSVAPSLWDKLNAQSEWAIFLVIGSLLAHMLSALHTFSTSKNTS